eukprot:5244332-Amphidinium_carterae.1
MVRVLSLFVAQCFHLEPSGNIDHVANVIKVAKQVVVQPVTCGRGVGLVPASVVKSSIVVRTVGTGGATAWKFVIVVW